MSESTVASNSAAPSTLAGGRMKFFVGGAIILVVLGWLIVSNIEGSTAHYLTVGELMAEGPSDRMVRVTGLAVGG